MMKIETKQASAVKRIPKRTCVACRLIRPKRELIRLVHITDNGVEIDLTGKKTGRGAYLCPTHECWESGLKTGRLEHALRTTISSENRNELLRYVDNLKRDTNQRSNQ